MKKLVRWTATYETLIEVPDGATEQEVMDEAANINLDCKGSLYQSDTWEVEEIENPTKYDVACHKAIQS